MWCDITKYIVDIIVVNADTIELFHISLLLKLCWSFHSSLSPPHLDSHRRKREDLPILRTEVCKQWNTESSYQKPYRYSFVFCSEQRRLSEYITRYVLICPQLLYVSANRNADVQVGLTQHFFRYFILMYKTRFYSQL